MEASLVPSGSSGDPKTLLPTVLNVGSVKVVGSGTGVHQGNLVNVTVNQYIVPKGSDMDTDVVKELVTDAIKINTDTKKEFFKLREPGARGWLVSGVKAMVSYVPKRFRKLTGLFLLTSVIIVIVSVLFSMYCLHSSTSADSAVNSTLRLVTRQEWGALNTTGSIDDNVLPILRVVVAHTAQNFCITTPECITIVQDIQTVHQQKLGMSDIAYNFLIGGDGKAYEGRGWLLEGSHTKNYNARTLGVAFIGNYVNVMPITAMMEAFAELLQLSLALEYLSVDYDMVGQCQVKITASPGITLINNLTTWPHFNNSLSYDNCIDMAVTVPAGGFI